MSRLRIGLALARSLAIYYGVPFRARRLRGFYRQFVPPGSLCFDIGAHVGNRIRCWRSLGARVVAVEPHPDLLRVLRLLYGADPAVHLVPAALGSAPGTAPLLVDEGNLTVSTLSADWVERVSADPSFDGLRWQRVSETTVTTLDDLIARFGDPAFVKIDVEGFEAEVLAGASRPLRALSFEYLECALELALDCLDRLAQLGPYRYNWSRGESHRLVSAGWIDADGMRRLVERAGLGSGSGDIYAKRVEPGDI
jgi:FkbM family methyltransferase